MTDSNHTAASEQGDARSGRPDPDRSAPTPVGDRSPPVESLAGSGEALGVDPEMSRHVDIVLLGLMASGKSSVGRVVANELSRPFVDSDSIVALRTGRAPAELAEWADIEELHEVEAAAAKRVLGMHDGIVFAAAASAVDALTSDDLAGAWTVWLDASPEVLVERVRGGPDRPVQEATAREMLADQHRRRTPLGHRLADLVVETDETSVDDVAATVCIAWRSWARRAR